ncbi:unnamed protein product [Prunus armeniaca]
MPFTKHFLLFPFCPFSFSLSSPAKVLFAQTRSPSPVDFEPAGWLGWGAAIEDFHSLLEMLSWPSIFVWGGVMRIQPPLGFRV